ncbi:MAG: SCO family protein [Candidatus Dormibacterales bacterium]
MRLTPRSAGRLWPGLLAAATAVLAACGTAGAPVGTAPPAPAPTFGMTGTRLTHPAPSFTLTDQFGQTVSLSQFHGKVVILAFVDSQCTTVCPLTTQSMVDALRLLGNASSQVQLLGVDANPQATAVSDVMGYSQAHGLTHAWHFLTGSTAQLKAVWKAYGIYVQIVQGAIDHTPAMYVIDPQGRERVVYLTPMEYASLPQEGEILAGDASRLLPSHPRVLPVTAPPHLTSSTTQLPVLAGDWPHPEIEIGKGVGHLAVFWATWVPDAAANLTALNGYQQVAQARHLPSVVAIDVEPTETDPGAARAFLEQAGLLLYPVAGDTNGRVADLYSVQDLAWYTLTDARGRVLWQHDGWVSVADLESSVAKATGAR